MENTTAVSVMTAHKMQGIAEQREPGLQSQGPIYSVFW